MDLKELVKQAGIVGAGGAGFPSYAKLAGGADTLLINGAECEPLLYTDFIILKKELGTVLDGISAVIEKLRVKTTHLCIKAHTAKKLKYKDGDKLTDKISVKVLPDVYPMGDEVSLIYETTGRLVKPGTIPITVGVVVYNVETVYNIGILKRYGTPLYMKWLTVGGATEKAYVVKVPVGTKVADLLDSLGIEIPDEGYTVIDGGPSMGKVIDPDNASIKKTTKGILILPDTIQAIVSKYTNPAMAASRAETACCQCTRCTDMCPRALLGYPLEPHKMVRTAMGAAVALPHMVLSATLCCGCGICESIACCQGISPKSVISEYKALLAKNGMRFTAIGSYEATEEREYRKLPEERWARALGVEDFDKIPEYIGERVDFKRFEIQTSQNIGVPSIPCVKAGETVKAGDIIAEAAEGLSLPIHAPTNGKIIYTDARKIIIEV